VIVMGFKSKYWLEKDGELVFGTGRMELLRLISELGSLHQAAKSLAMSYRAAWGKIRTTESRLGWKLVEVKGRRRHMALTPEAKDLLERFTRFEEEADFRVQEVYDRYFPGGF
jgi:molybdate transport system regulatory protein